MSVRPSVRSSVRSSAHQNVCVQLELYVYSTHHALAVRVRRFNTTRYILHALGGRLSGLNATRYIFHSLGGRMQVNGIKIKHESSLLYSCFQTLEYMKQLK